MRCTVGTLTLDNTAGYTVDANGGNGDADAIPAAGARG